MIIRRLGPVMLMTVLLSGLLPIAPAAAATWDVAMLDHAFDPAVLNITVGDTVTWTNTEEHDDQHTVTSTEDRFDSPLIGGGESFSLTFNQVGDFPYFCKTHGLEMNGIVRVREPGQPFAVEDALRFTRNTGDTTAPTGSVNLLANDVEPDGETLSLTDHDQTGSNGGTLSCTPDGACTYQGPSERCPWTDTFSYTISDPGGKTDTSVFEVTASCSGPASSATAVELALKRHLRAAGSLGAELPGCIEFRLLTVQRVTRSGAWRKVGSTSSDSDGLFTIKLADKAGRYRVKAAASTLETGEDCLPATSDVRRHRH